MTNILSDVTFCMTSCNRNELLFKTLDSFLKLNNYPIHSYFIKEDSGNDNIVNEIKERYPYINVIGGKNLGQAKSIDLLYSIVKTPFIFHCEEDWEFIDNKQFIKESLCLLNELPNIHQVWIRKDINEEWLHKEIEIVNNIQYRYVRVPHLGIWNGFSWNPGLRRLSDYNIMFPNGYHEIGNEYNCVVHSNKFNYRAVQLVKGSCNHIGWGNLSTHYK